MPRAGVAARRQDARLEDGPGRRGFGGGRLEVGGDADGARRGLLGSTRPGPAAGGDDPGGEPHHQEDARGRDHDASAISSPQDERGRRGDALPPPDQGSMERRARRRSLGPGARQSRAHRGSAWRARKQVIELLRRRGRLGHLGRRGSKEALLEVAPRRLVGSLGGIHHLRLVRPASAFVEILVLRSALHCTAFRSTRKRAG